MAHDGSCHREGSGRPVANKDYSGGGSGRDSASTGTVCERLGASRCSIRSGGWSAIEKRENKFLGRSMLT